MDPKNNFTLGILAAADPRDVKTWSGVPYFMSKSLEKLFPNIEYFYPEDSIKSPHEDLMIHLHWKLTRKRYIPNSGVNFLKKRAQTIDKQLKETPVDVLLAITADQLIAFLETDIPIVHHSDATFRVMHEYYPRYSSLWGFARRQADKYTRRALTKAHTCTFPSQWAANSAINDYQINENAVHVVPYGANLVSTPSFDEEKTVNEPCNLLFIGGHWERKGGPIVYQTLMELLKRGMQVNLNVVGCKPENEHENMQVHSFLNKQIPEQLETYNQLWADADFLFMPSTQETFGAIYAEAAAHGVPAIACDTGGVSSCVQHNVSGILLPVDKDASAFADEIELIWKDPKRYSALSKGARNAYENTLNWETYGAQIAKIINSIK